MYFMITCGSFYQLAFVTSFNSFNFFYRCYKGQHKCLLTLTSPCTIDPTDESTLEYIISNCLKLENYK